jgi:hypothetical protein
MRAMSVSPRIAPAHARSVLDVGLAGWCNGRDNRFSFPDENCPSGKATVSNDKADARCSVTRGRGDRAGHVGSRWPWLLFSCRWR